VGWYLWCFSNPDANIGRILYSYDDGISWNIYPLQIYDFTMLKRLPGDKFIGGDSEGELLQYNASISNCRIKGKCVFTILIAMV